MFKYNKLKIVYKIRKNWIKYASDICFIEVDQLLSYFAVVIILEQKCKTNPCLRISSKILSAKQDTEIWLYVVISFININ